MEIRPNQATDWLMIFSDFLQTYAMYLANSRTPTVLFGSCK